MKLSIGKKLGIGFLFVSLLIVLVGYLGLHGIYRVRDINRVMEKTDHLLWELAELHSIAANQIDYGMHFLFLGNEDDAREFREAGKTFRKKLHSFESNAPELRDSLFDFASAHAELEQLFWRIEKEHRKGGGLEFSERERLHEMWHPHEEKLVTMIKAASAVLIERHLKANQLVSKSLRNTVVIMAGSALLIFLVAGFVGFYISKKISRSIVDLKDAAVRIGEQDLTTRITVHTGDEIETLADEFNRMAERLSESYATLEERVQERTIELKAAENEARAAGQKAELMLKTIPSGLMTVDLDRRITSWNKYAEVITGVSAEEAIGQECLFVFESEECCKNCALYSEDITKPVFNKECVITVKGKNLTISKNLEVLRDNEGNVVGGLESFVDITYRKQMEEQLVRSERYKTISDISRDIAHNFNNLLTTVKGNVQLLLMDKDLTADEEVKTSLDEIHERTNDMAQLVSDMQHFSRDNEVFSDEKTDIIPVLELAVKMLRPVWKDEARKNGIDIDIIHDIVDVPHVRGGRQDHQTIFKNILLNAIEAMTRSGKIWIRTSLATEDSADFVRVAICDEGRGMDDAVRARALEPLFSTKSTVGVGMGLSVVYGLVQNLGGTLTIESKLDQGTTVVVTVPVADAESIPAISTYEKQDEKAEQQGKVYQILVADDEESVRDLLSRSLQMMGHKVVGAANGVEALRIAQDKRFDLAFVDWSMPNMNGLELMKKLQETCPEMPVVMVTGWSDKENMQSLSAAGIDHVITKPFDMESIGEAIDKYIV